MGRWKITPINDNEFEAYPTSVYFKLFFEVGHIWPYRGHCRRVVKIQPIQIPQAPIAYRVSMGRIDKNIR